MGEGCSPGYYKFRFGHVWGGLNTGKIVPTSWLCGRRDQQRDNGRCPSSLHPEAMQLSFPCVCLSPSLSSPATVRFARRAQGKCLQVNESVCGTFKGMPGFLAASLPPEWTEFC